MKQATTKAQAQKVQTVGSREQLIARLLAKSELNFKCCSNSCGHVVKAK